MNWVLLRSFTSNYFIKMTIFKIVILLLISRILDRFKLLNKVDLNFDTRNIFG